MQYESMTKTDKTVAARAVACNNGWRWMPGMLMRSVDHGVQGPRLMTVADCEVAAGLGWRPDLDDPATLGCLLALVREAWGDPELSTHGGEHTGWSVTLGSDRGYGDVVADGRTEAAALVAALEAAP